MRARRRVRWLGGELSRSRKRRTGAGEKLRLARLLLLCSGTRWASVSVCCGVRIRSLDAMVVLGADGHHSGRRWRGATMGLDVAVLDCC